MLLLNSRVKFKNSSRTEDLSQSESSVFILKVLRDVTIIKKRLIAGYCDIVPRFRIKLAIFRRMSTRAISEKYQCKGDVSESVKLELPVDFHSEGIKQSRATLFPFNPETESPRIRASACVWQRHIEFFCAVEHEYVNRLTQLSKWV